MVVVGVLSNNLCYPSILAPIPGSITSSHHLTGGTEKEKSASLRLCARPSSNTTSDSLTVYVFLEDECLISQYYTNELTRLYDQYHSSHVGFVGYFPSPTTGPEEIATFADEFKLAFPLLPDHDKSWTKKFEITVTPEVAVLDHRTDRTIYRGRIDDSYVRVGKRKLHPQTHDLEDMIKTWQLNKVPETTVETEAIGCFITFEK